MWKKLSKTTTGILRALEGTGRTPRRPHRARPGIEALEGRAVPATFLVNTFADAVANDNLLSLREAINRANATPGADVIQLQAGTYRIQLTGAEDNSNAAGDFDVTDSLTIVGRGAGLTRVEGNTVGLRERLVNPVGPINMTFNDLTLRKGGNGQSFGGAVQALTANITLNNCVVSGNAGLKGGAINAESGNVTLRNTRVLNNGSVTDGGGILATNGNVVLVNSVVTGNAATGKGGGVFTLRGAVTLSASTVSLNRAQDGGGVSAEAGTVSLVSGSSVRRNTAGSATPGASFGRGGGVFAATVNVTSSSVSGNLGTIGGGIFAGTANLVVGTVNGNTSRREGGGILAANATLANSTVSANSAGGSGGGVLATVAATLTTSTVGYNRATGTGGGVRSEGTATLVRSTVCGNSGDIVGGVSAPTANLTNSTVSGNSARNGAGGVSAARGSILSCTVVENFTSEGFSGGVEVLSRERIQVKNSIIADNYRPTDRADVFGLFFSDGRNLIGVVDGGAQGFSATGDLLGTALDPLDPMLGDLANNGGPTRTHAPQAGSPVIDKGNNVGIPATDQRGVARTRDGDGNGSLVVDIGAVER